MIVAKIDGVWIINVHYALKGVENKVESSELIINYIKDKDQVVILGDLNSLPFSVPVTSLGLEYYVSGVDYIFWKGLDFKGGEILPTNGSDHLPILAYFSYN